MDYAIYARIDMHRGPTPYAEIWADKDSDDVFSSEGRTMIPHSRFIVTQTYPESEDDIKEYKPDENDFHLTDKMKAYIFKWAKEKSCMPPHASNWGSVFSLW